MQVHVNLILEFQEAFPNETPLTPEEYLNGADKDLILKAAAFFLGFNSDSKYNNSKELLERLFNVENESFANEIYKRVVLLEVEDATVLIINPYSSLRLFEFFFLVPKEDITQSQTEFEQNLFKAYLLFNSEFTTKQELAFSSTKDLNDDLKIPMAAFCMHYAIADKFNYNLKQITGVQLIKAYYLFLFLESDPRMKALLKVFLEKFKCENWQMYINNLISLLPRLTSGEQESNFDFSVKRDKKFENNCNFLDQLITDSQDTFDKVDFLTLRSKPFYKVSTGLYRVIFRLFVIEKIFKGAYFFLRDINQALPQDTKIKEFKSYYGDEFSEKYLLYKVCKSIFPYKVVMFSGQEILAYGLSGEPDFYVRNGKNILLFESKDFLITVENKMSFDFNVYETEFKRILYYEDVMGKKRKRKAILQIVDNIKRI